MGSHLEFDPVTGALTNVPFQIAKLDMNLRRSREAERALKARTKALRHQLHDAHSDVQRLEGELMRFKIRSLSSERVISPLR